MVTVGCRHGLEVGRSLDLRSELCGRIAGCALCVGIVQAELEEKGDSFIVLVGGAWTVCWTCCWVFPKLYSTGALTRTQSGEEELPFVHRCRENRLERMTWLVG